MEDIERLVALQKIQELKHTYCHAVDAKDWGLMASIFTPDGRADMREAGPNDNPNMILVEGRDEMMAFVSEAVKDWRTIHHVHSPIISFDDGSRATGIWQMDDQIFSLIEGEWKLHLHGFGHYREIYEKRDGRWLIHEVKLTRTHLISG